MLEGVQQLDLFATGSGGSAAPTPEWRRWRA